MSLNQPRNEPLPGDISELKLVAKLQGAEKVAVAGIPNKNSVNERPGVK